MKTDHPAAPIPTPAGDEPIVVTARDVQRKTLADLVRLATECTTLDAQIEKRLADKTLAADRSLKADSVVATTAGVDRLSASQQSRGSELEKIEGAYRVDRARADKSRDDQARKVNADYDNLAGKIKAEFQDARWLVDSILDTAVLEAHKAHKASMEKTANDRLTLDEERDKGLASLHRYGRQHLAEMLATLPEQSPKTPDEFEPAKAALAADVRSLNGLPLARLFVGVWPFLVGLVIVGGAIAATQPWKTVGTSPDWFKLPAYAGGGALLLVIVAAMLLLRVSNGQIRRGWDAILNHLAAAHASLDARIVEADKTRDAALVEAKHENAAETKKVNDKYEPIAARAKAKRDELLYGIKTKHDAQHAARSKLREADLLAARHRHEGEVQAVERDRDASLAGLQKRRVDVVGVARSEYDQARAELQARWDAGLEATRAQNEKENAADSVRVGSLTIDLARIAAESGSSAAVARLVPPPPYQVPAWLSMPRQASLLIEHDRAKRDDAIELLRATMFNLLATITPGRVKFTLIDPVGLGQSFAGFMHLADYDDSLVGGRIWSESDDIEQRLADLTEHMETVIQKYLRNEFHTIDEYNAQAGELAEPYRFLVIADLPTSFSDESLRRLANVAASGARCGVYVLVTRDIRVPIAGTLMEDLRNSCTVLKQTGDRFDWQDEVFGRFAYTPPTRPGDDAMTGVLHEIGKKAKDNKRIAVPFEIITPKPEEMWSLKSDLDVAVPVGRTGATRLQTFRLGRGVAQHALIAGKTGSGKSTLLNVMITNLAMWYPPSELELYLIDFKRGVEFKAYATQRLPHARAIAVESDREFGLSVLQRLDAEIGRRGEIYRQVGAQDVASYRKAVRGGTAQASLPKTLPRILLIVDEFQEMFTEDDRVSQEAATLYDRLIRQGRAFGIHVVLGSQTIGGSTSLPRTTLGQMAVRVALQTTEADSQLILGDNNSAARLLTRPGEAIYNDAGGAVENNSPFQISWLSDEDRENALKRTRKLADERNEQSPSVAVFEGNAPAELANNRELAEQLKTQPSLTSSPPMVAAAIGEAVAIKPPTSIALRRRAGSNVMLVGQQEEQAMAVLATIALSTSAQTPTKNGTKFYVLDSTPVDSALFGKLPGLVKSLPQPGVDVGYRDVPTTINALADELKERQASDETRETILVLINGLQRYRELRKTEENFSFSMDADDAPKAAAADKSFAELIKEGPAFGIHVVAWIDTVAALDRTFDRTMLREFDHRILFQMSAADSAHLIDSAAGNKLGVHRAIYFSEEQGIIEKFRPYGMPEPLRRD